MAEDKITVNDALISTDVDRLIRTIAEKKRISVKDLEHNCGMDRRAVDKWIRVLEDEGYISVVYGLTGTSVLWLGESQEPRKVREDDLDRALSAMPKTKNENYDQVFDELVSEKNSVSKDSDTHEDDIKSNILSDFDKRHEEEEKGEGASYVEPHSPPDEPQPPRPDFDSEENEPIEEEIAGHEEKFGMPEPIETPSRRSGNSARVKDMVNAYLNQINKEKAEIEKLKAEKDRVYRERYLSMESKVEADIASITERILEKEGRVVEIKERVLELPDKINEVEKVHDAVKKLESDGREVLEKAKERADKFIDVMSKSRESLKKQMEDGKDRIRTEKEKIEELDGLSLEMEKKLDDVKKTLDETQEQVTALNDSMKDLIEDLEQNTEMKVEISDMIEDVRGSISEKEGELNELEKQMSEIRQVEQWVREYLADYERKIEEITSYVRSGDEEIASLKEKAEGAYMQKYLRELDEITSLYDDTMNEVTSEEKSLDSKISDAKSRLASLVKESKEVIARLRTEGVSETDFEVVRQEAQNKSATVLQVLDEKEGERGKLFEDFQRARGGKPLKVLPKPIASKSRPSKKSKKKSALLRKLKGKKKRK